MTNPVVLECRGVGKSYTSSNGAVVQALDGIDLTVTSGEFVSVVGSSGSGKSTLLRILAGLETPTSGTVSRDMSILTPRVGVVFQTDSLFPWRTVEQNLAYALEARGASRHERKTRAIELCRAVDLSPEAFLTKFPRELSGGEARRVSIGIALSAEAPLLLLDEPTSQLDYVSRRRLQATVYELWDRARPTIVCVTHDVEEAILLSENVVVLNRGRIQDRIPVNLPFPRGPEALASQVGKAALEHAMRCIAE